MLSGYAAAPMIERVRANGLEFAYLAEGKGPLVLLLHGFPDSAYGWDRTRPALAAAGFRAVSPFLRGYAPTAIPTDGDYRVDTLARDAGALIAALGAERAVVVGHDWGASAAYGVANLSPERVRALFTLAIPHPAAISRSPLLLWKARHFIALRRKNAVAMASANDFAYIDELARRWSPAWKFSPDETAAVKKIFADPLCLEAACGYYRAIGVSVPQSVRGRISVPTVMFAGATDPFFEPAAYERARRHFTAGYEVVALPGGHFLHREHPDEFNAALLRRLGTLGAGW